MNLLKDNGLRCAPKKPAINLILHRKPSEKSAARLIETYVIKF